MSKNSQKCNSKLVKFAPLLFYTKTNSQFPKLSTFLKTKVYTQLVKKGGNIHKFG